MDGEKSKALMEEFPSLFGDLPFGFECGDGWFELIHTLAQSLSQYPDLRATQVKEKFGGLRFYAAGIAPDEAWQAMASAEDRSCEICEKCGAPGTLIALTKYWVGTRCDQHGPRHIENAT